MMPILRDALFLHPEESRRLVSKDEGKGLLRMKGVLCVNEGLKE